MDCKLGSKRRKAFQVLRCFRKPNLSGAEEAAWHDLQEVHEDSLPRKLQPFAGASAALREDAYPPAEPGQESHQL